MASIAEALHAALDLHGKGRLDDAEILYGRILDADPDNPQALYLAGTLLCQRGRFAEARPLLGRAAALRPDSVSVHLTLARIAVQEGDWEGGAARTRRALTLDPADGEAWNLLGAALRRTGQPPDHAVASLHRACRAAPDRADLGRMLGLLLHERGRRRLHERRAQAALSDLTAAAALLPFDPELGFTLASALTETGRAEAALALHHRLAAMAPAEGRVLHNLGISLLRAGRAAAAVRVLLRAAAADPDSSDPCEGLAEAFDTATPDAERALFWSTRALSLKLEREPAPFAAEEPGAGAPGERRRVDVVSYSLWGALEVYCAGAIENARLMPALLPGWRCRFHHDDTVPAHVLAELAALGAELVAMPPGSAERRGMFWRFLPADDPTVRRFLVRDADSRPTRREIAAVEAWIASGAPFHVMRDHVMHMEPVMGGMWGGVAGLLPPIEPAIDRFMEARSGRWNDQHFLAEWLWPRIARRALVHDGVHANVEGGVQAGAGPGFGHPFPDAAGEAGEPGMGGGHVGAKLLQMARLPPPRPPAGPDDVAEADGRQGWLVFPAGDPHAGRSLAELGEWLEIETAFAARLLAPGDAAVDLDAGFGVHALAFARAVGAGGRVLAVEPDAGLSALLARTVAANRLGAVATVLREPPTAGMVRDAGADRPRLIRAAVAASAMPLSARLAAFPGDHRPAVFLRVDDDAAAADAFAFLRACGWRLWWRLAPVFNPANRRGRAANPFPGLVTVNALALPVGAPAPAGPPPDGLVEITGPDADWRVAAWKLRCDGT